MRAQPLPRRQGFRFSVFATLPGSTFLAACAALVPAFYIWWQARALVRNADDPLLAEKLLAVRLRARLVLAAAWAVLIVGWWQLWHVLLPLMIAARALAAYPFRRELQHETWGPFTYLWFFTRLVAAVFGFWILLMSAPWLALAAGAWARLVSAVLACVLLAWHRHHPVVVRRLLRCRPVADADLANRFASVASRAAVPAPFFGIVPIDGGVFANAVALPSLRNPAVLFSSTLVERLEVEEVVAICAHELAHLEHFSGARLRRINAGVIALIVVGAAFAQLSPAVVPAMQGWLPVVWMATVVTYMALRARSRQKEETASDLRAVEWTGTPEALASALAKVHAIGRLPRRWETQFERQATHPSLARRIQAIRNAGGQPYETLTEPATFVAGKQSIVLHPDYLQVSEGDLATHRFAYGHLTELRLDAGRSGTPQLIAIERNGRRWTLPIDAADVGRVQAALDVVDVRLARLEAPPTYAKPAIRAVSGVIAMVAVSATYISAAIPALLTFAAPSRPMSIAAGAGAIGAAALACRDGLTRGDGATCWTALLLASCGGVTLAIAWMSRRDTQPSASVRPFAVLTLCTALVWVLLLAAGPVPDRLYQAARQSTAAVVLPLALAAGLWAMRRRPARHASAVVALGCVAVFSLGTQAFLESFSADPFALWLPPLTLLDTAAAPIEEVPLPSDAADLRLAPSAAAIAFADEVDDDEDETRTFHIGRFSGPYATVTASEAFFLDDHELVLLDRLREGTAIRVVELSRENEPRWSRTISELMSASLSVNSDTGTWRLLGNQEHDATLIEGDVRGITAERRWPRGVRAWDRDAGWTEPVAASDTTVLMQQRKYTPGPFDRSIGRSLLSTFALMYAPRGGVETRLWTIAPAGNRALGTSFMNPECHDVARQRGRPLCVAFDGVRSKIFSADLRAATLEAVGSVEGRLYEVSDSGSGWLTARSAGGALAIRDDGKAALQLPHDGSEWIERMVVNDRFVAVLANTRSATALRLYKR
jgi:Zn-dependent protease with chaperone function